MKLFGGKKGDEKAAAQGDDEAGYYDSPQETVSLSGPRNPPASAAKPSAGGAPAAVSPVAAAPARVIGRSRSLASISAAWWAAT